MGTVERLDLLKQLSFGSQVAEEEMQHLESYFFQTDQWNRIVNGNVDIVRGEKGAGKSAIFLLLKKQEGQLFDRGVILVSGENPRGATVFRDLISDPPTSEQEFVVLWKLYLLTIICHELRGLDIRGEQIEGAYAALEDAALMERELNLPGLLRSAQALARRLLSSARLEAGVELDPTTGTPSGIIGRISLTEPTGVQRSQGISSIDGLFEKVNSTLSAKKITVWVLLDRLDVAFAESHELEANAIRALMRVYADLRALESIALKVFLREDIWKRITSGGLREASHITRFIVMNWTPPMLRNLIMLRLISNPVLIKEFNIVRDEVIKDAKKQDDLFNRIFPAQVDQGTRKPSTWDWMLTRCADGTGSTAPRELIHLLICIRDEEIKRLERGGTAAPGEQLFDRSVFKAALPIVSSNRIQTYLYAEYPNFRPLLEKLEGQKSEQTPESLAEMWGISRQQAIDAAIGLVEIGFFQDRGTRAEPSYWVPFLYRDALHLIQGKAEADED